MRNLKNSAAAAWSGSLNSRLLPTLLWLTVFLVSTFSFVFQLEARVDRPGASHENTQHDEAMTRGKPVRIAMKSDTSTDSGSNQPIQPGQGAVVPAAKPQGDQGAKESKPGLFTMNFKDVDLEVLIKFISEITGKNFVVDPTVKGRVTILCPEKVTVEEAYRVFLSVLDINDFTTVPAGKVIKIIKATEARGKGVETILGKEFKTPEDKIITQLYPLKYSDASDLAKMLRPLVPKTGLLIPYAETNTLIIIDVLSNIYRLMRVSDLRHSRRLVICEPLKADCKPRATSKVAAICLIQP